MDLALQARRERQQARGACPAGLGRGYLRTLPNSDALETLAYRFAILGYIFWTFTLIAGAIWANESWGRYWGFDVKEVWTFVIWVLYAGYIHARVMRGWRGTRSAWLSLIGFAAVLFNFTIVNLFKGLHAYSGISEHRATHPHRTDNGAARCWPRPVPGPMQCGNPRADARIGELSLGQHSLYSSVHADYYFTPRRHEPARPGHGRSDALPDPDVPA